MPKRKRGSDQNLPQHFNWLPPPRPLPIPSPPAVASPGSTQHSSRNESLTERLLAEANSGALQRLQSALGITASPERPPSLLPMIAYHDSYRSLQYWDLPYGPQFYRHNSTIPILNQANVSAYPGLGGMNVSDGRVGIQPITGCPNRPPNMQPIIAYQHTPGSSQFWNQPNNGIPARPPNTRPMIAVHHGVGSSQFWNQPIGLIPVRPPNTLPMIADQHAAGSSQLWSQLDWSTPTRPPNIRPMIADQHGARSSQLGSQLDWSTPTRPPNIRPTIADQHGASSSRFRNQPDSHSYSKCGSTYPILNEANTSTYRGRGRRGNSRREVKQERIRATLTPTGLIQPNRTEEVCGICETELSQKQSPNGRTQSSTLLPVVAVLACHHVFHAECLEQGTSPEDAHDPSCPLCTLLAMENEAAEAMLNLLA